jgi:hypothetical protein
MEKRNLTHQHSSFDHEEKRYAYFAALLDGEGTIGMRPQGRGYMFRLRVEMADHEMMSRITCIFGYGSMRPGSKRENRLPTWVWQTGAQEAVRDILMRIHPHVHAKRSQVDLVLDCLCKPNRTLREMDRYFVELWKLKLKKPRSSRNQYGECTLHIDKLRRRYPRWFDDGRYAGGPARAA